MSMAMTAAPAVEPMTLAESKAHLRVDGTSEDAFLTSLIVTSRLQIEAALGLALITQSWRLTLDRWRDDVVELPLWPVQSVAAIEVANASGGATALSASAYHLDGRARPPRIVLNSDPPQPAAVAQGISIGFTAGFGSLPSDVPQPIRHALLLLVAHWYENREPQSAGAAAARIPDAVSSLLAPYRSVRL